MKKYVFWMVVSLMLLPFAVSQTEHLIPLQGQASDSSGNLLSTGNVSVRIYDAAIGGNLVFNAGFINAIQNGIYDVLLGSTAPLSLDNTKKYFMEIDINHEEVVGDDT